MPRRRAVGFFFFFYCVAELAIKPCRSSRSKTRGGLRVGSAGWSHNRSGGLVGLFHE